MSTLAQTNGPSTATVQLYSRPNRRGAQNWLAAWAGQDVTQTAPIRVVTFVLLAASGALSQPRPSPDLPQQSQFDDSNSPQAQRQQIPASDSLPDAPSSVQPPTQTERFPAFVNEARSPLTVTLTTAGITAGIMRETAPGYLTPRLQPIFIPRYQTVFTPADSSAFLDKYLVPSLLQQNLHYHPSTSDTFMGRASDAASRIFI